MEKVENEKIYKIILAIFTAFCFSIIAIFCLFCIGLSKVDAATWIEFRKEGDEFLCGTQKDYLSCPYETNIIGYNLIIENIELKSNKTYELEIYWNLQTSITRGDIDGYINEKNWKNLTATIDGKLWGVNGPSLPTKNRTWQKVNQYRILGVGNQLDTAVYQYKYSNVFDIPSTENYERLYFEVRKRQQWKSLGVPPLTIPLIDPYIILSEFTYTLSEIDDKGVANIIASGNKNAEDIMNNQNQNADKVVDAIEGEGLKDTKPIDPNKKDELEKIEEGLLDENISTELKDIDISIDKNTNEFIWNLVTRIVNTHTMIFGLVLAMLSLGVLKLVLNR